MRKVFLLFCISITVNFFSQVNLSSSLTACYDLDGNATEPINNSAGTLSSVTPTVNRFNINNSALAFSGSTASYVELPDNTFTKPLNGMSFSCWFKPSGNSVQPGYILFTKNTLNSNFEAYNLCVAPINGIRFMARKVGPIANNQVVSTTTPAVNTWYHLAITIDNSAVKIYVNSVMEASTVSTFSGFDYVGGKKVYLGGTNETSYNTPLLGTIDNARFYSRAITAAEVNALYTQDPSCGSFFLNPPVASFTASSTKICEGGVITFTDLSTNSPTSWSWQINGGNPSTSTLSNPSATFSTAGNYAVSLTSSNSAGASNVSTQTIQVFPNPTLVLVPSSSTLCSGQSATLVASGAPTLIWNGSQTANSMVITPSVNSSYTVVGIDNNGCTNSVVTTISLFPLPSVSASPKSFTMCENEQMIFTASGASSYVWNSGQVGPSYTLGPVPAGTQTFYVTGFSAMNCINTASVSVLVNKCNEIAEENIDNKFSLFPNPSNDRIHLNFYGSIISGWKIFDLTGKEIKSSENLLRDYSEIDISSFPKGIYLIRMLSINFEYIQHFIKE